jgi:hypothetical protein
MWAPFGALCFMRDLRRLIAGMNAAAFAFAFAVHLFTWVSVLPLSFVLALELIIPIVPLVVSIVAVEHEATMTRRLQQALNAGLPTWARRTVLGVFAYFVVIFLSFLIYSRGGSLGFHNGQHVLERGQEIIRTLNEAAYLAFKNWETRFFSAGAMSFYAIGAFYWWFPRKEFSRLLQNLPQ